MPCTHHVTCRSVSAVPGAEPGGVQPVAGRVAERRPHLEAGLVDRDPQRLEREPAQRQEEQQAEERPVAGAVRQLRRPRRQPPPDEEPDPTTSATPNRSRNSE